MAKLLGAPIQLHSDARECAHGPEPERAQQEGWRGRHQPGRDMRARISAGLFSNLKQTSLLAGVQAMADQEMGRSLNPLPYHIMDYLWTMVNGTFAIFEKGATGIPFSTTKGKQLLVDVMLSARRNFNLVCARVSTRSCRARQAVRPATRIPHPPSAYTTRPSRAAARSPRATRHRARAAPLVSGHTRRGISRIRRA